MSEKLTVGELVYKISGDMDNLKTELARADTEVKNLKNSMEKAGDQTTALGKQTDSTAKSFFKGALAYDLFTRGLDFARQAFQASIKNGSDLAESINAVNVVFGEGADEILKFGKSAATSAGLARAEFNQMAVLTGALLKDTGLSMEEVAEKTTELTTRAADMASVFNTDVKDAASAINQAIRGETEAIRRYAGDVTDASLQTFLFSQGINKNVTQLTEQEKRLYRVDLIMKQTEVTAGDFANTSDSLANRQRILNARVTNFSANLGKSLLPALSNVLGAFIKTDKQSKDNTKSFDTFGKTVYQLSNVVIVLGATISNFAAVTKIAWNGVQVAFKSGAVLILEAMKQIRKAIGKDTEEIDSALNAMAESIITDSEDVQDAFTQMAENSKTIEEALNQTFNPTNYKPIQETGAVIDDLATSTSDLGSGLDDTKEKAEDFTDQLLSLRDEAKKTGESLEKDLGDVFSKFSGDAKTNFEESINTLAQTVIKAEDRLKAIKDELKGDNVSDDQRKTLKDEQKQLKEVLEAREDFEQRQADRINAIKTKLEEAGIDSAKAGIDNLLSVRSLEEQIEEERRIASLDEFTRFEEEQARKLVLLTDNFITEATLLQNKIAKQKEYEADVTTFLLSEEKKRLENTEVWASATIAKYGQVADSLKNLLSTQAQLRNVQVGAIAPTQAPRGDITPPQTTNNSSTNNTNISAPVTINGQSINNLNPKEISAILGFELNKFIR